MLLHEGACTFPLPPELYRVRFAHSTPTTQFFFISNFFNGALNFDFRLSLGSVSAS
jgi:hypothetical protein